MGDQRETSIKSTEWAYKSKEFDGTGVQWIKHISFIITDD